jgi:hypothetical protein
MCAHIPSCQFVTLVLFRACVLALVHALRVCMETQHFMRGCPSQFQTSRAL